MKKESIYLILKTIEYASVGLLTLLTAWAFLVFFGVIEEFGLEPGSTIYNTTLVILLVTLTAASHKRTNLDHVKSDEAPLTMSIVPAVTEPPNKRLLDYVHECEIDGHKMQVMWDSTSLRVFIDGELRIHENEPGRYGTKIGEDVFSFAGLHEVNLKVTDSIVIFKNDQEVLREELGRFNALWIFAALATCGLLGHMLIKWIVDL